MSRAIVVLSLVLLAGCTDRSKDASLVPEGATVGHPPPPSEAFVYGIHFKVHQGRLMIRQGIIESVGNQVCSGDMVKIRLIPASEHVEAWGDPLDLKELESATNPYGWPYPDYWPVIWHTTKRCGEPLDPEAH